MVAQRQRERQAKRGEEQKAAFACLSQALAAARPRRRLPLRKLQQRDPLATDMLQASELISKLLEQVALEKARADEARNWEADKVVALQEAVADNVALRHQLHSMWATVEWAQARYRAHMPANSDIEGFVRCRRPSESPP